MKVSQNGRQKGLALVCVGALLGVWAFTLSGCSGLLSGQIFKERAAETPAPDDQIYDKSFFVDAGGKPKTFLCAWAPEVAQGLWAEEELLPLVADSGHCNVQFEIKRDLLVAKMLNPSFPNDSTGWVTAMTIPITKHFYYEPEKDSHGRDTNRWIENESRSDWSARPKIRLNLSGINILDLGTVGWGPFSITSAEDIEFDPKTGFLGFTITAIHHADITKEFQGRYRINFLKFEHDPTFKKVPYNQDNATFLNALHIMSSKVQGVVPEYYVAHWDVRQTTNVYITGVPKELERTVVGAVYKWNQTLVDTGVVPPGHVAFAPYIKELKHPFDLRYPTINYIANRRVGDHTPLGVGSAAADLQNGKILWGSVTEFGGVLEGYINSYTASSVEDSNGATKVASLSPFDTLAAVLPNQFPTVQLLPQTSEESMLNDFATSHKNFLEIEPQRPAEQRGFALTPAQVDGLQRQLEVFKSQDTNLRSIVKDVRSQAIQQVSRANQYFLNHSLQANLRSASGAGAPSSAEMAMQKMDPQLVSAIKEQNAEKRRQMVRMLLPQHNAVFVEQELTAGNYGTLLMTDPTRKNRNFSDMLESVIMNLTLHEFGHFVGLGHQFKENIVPVAGTVPSRYVRDLTERATAEKGFSETTSVMGYRHGSTEMAVPADQLKPGPQDELVVRYLYKGEYAAFDESADDWAYGLVDGSGKIPLASNLKSKSGAMKTMKSAYFPQCNDIEASLAMDPYCNRWDYGNSAQDIVSSYVGYVSNNLIHNLYSFGGGSGIPAEVVESRLYASALMEFSRIRIFYDEMRRRLRSQPHLADLWDELRADKFALLEFSSACRQDDPTGDKVHSKVLRKIFADPVMVDLCRANYLALNEFKFFLTLPAADFVKVDNSNHSISGGIFAGDGSQNWSRVFGSWYQMTNLPLKYMALYMVTTATPPILWGNWMLPNWSYDSVEDHYVYSTLYPSEYTDIISSTVDSNMQFAATGNDKTTIMGRSILAAGSLLELQHYTSGDPGRVPTEFTNLLNKQTDFHYGMVAVLINAAPRDSNDHLKTDHYRKFTATIFDFMTGQNSVARDVFILPRGGVLVWASGMFIYPITPLKFYKKESAYVMAYKVDFDRDSTELYGVSLRKTLIEKHDKVIEACIKGFNGNGLLYHFAGGDGNPVAGGQDKATSFAGFHIPPGIETETSDTKTNIFYQSIEDAYNDYEAEANPSIPSYYKLKSMRAICDAAVRGVGQISSAAALINGQWLGITADYIEK